MSDALFNELVDAVINEFESGANSVGMLAKDDFLLEYSGYAMELRQLASLLHKAGYKKLKDLPSGLDWYSMENNRISISSSQVKYLFTYCQRVIDQREIKRSRFLTYISIVLAAVAAVASVAGLVIECIIVSVHGSTYEHRDAISE